MEQQVVVVGAGPVGLWLAAELRLGGVSVTLLEAREERDSHSKALTLHPRTLEILAFRGLVEKFLTEGVRLPDGHFGGLDDRMDFSVLDTPFPFTLALPQARTEELLEEHARAAGVRIRRGHRVVGLAGLAGSEGLTASEGLARSAELTGSAGPAGPTGPARRQDSVTVAVEGPDGPYTLEAAYVVGCDGTRSTVRGAAGIDFPGTDATIWGWLGDVVLDSPPQTRGISVSNLQGGLMALRMPGGFHRFIGIGRDDVRTDPSGELTLEELRDNVVRITGDDFGMRAPVWLSRFGNATRQAARYRAGRVLLAGDAAHMHFPTGGVGLNIGVQDATNLGWKLAATLNGTAPDSLLDSYHDERHPVGADLLESTRAQTALITGFTPEGQALRSFLSQLIATRPEFSKDLAERVSALAVAYPPVTNARDAPDAPDTLDASTVGVHPLTGRRAPDLAFASHGKSLFGLLNDGRHVLLDLTGTLTGAAGGRPLVLAPDITVHSAPLSEPPAGPRPEWSGVRAALIRPDGHVAWASEEHDDDALVTAVRTAVAATRA
ncbi:FAD-dependent monooxygenase [Streptomyces sp. NPDC088400]|uniref:FAD-dependent monooxygenase n=1 Tax=Streptomyces sp. NPDC088400 TaxID=3365861 RepID=UPI003823119A